MRKLAALEAARGSFQDAVDAIERCTGQRLGKRQVEELATLGAIDFEDFYEARRPKRAKPDQLLVLSADGKGIVMRPDALRPKAATRAARASPKPRTRLSAAEKPGHKRIAEIGAVYDATPAPRAPGRHPRPREAARQRTGPGAGGHQQMADRQHRQSSRGRDRPQGFDEAQRRDPKHRRTWLALVDGANHQIQRIKYEAKTRGVTVTIICDFVHVLEYLWNAAGCFYPEGDPAAQNWVHHQASRVLEGRATKVAGTIRRKATTTKLNPGVPWV